MRCVFDEAWRGQCQKEAGPDGVCEEHRKERCCCCGEQAVKSCSYVSQFVCGAPLCADCRVVTTRLGHRHERKA